MLTDDLLDELVAVPEQDGAVTPANGEVSVAVTSQDMITISSVDGDAGVLVSRIDDASGRPTHSFTVGLSSGATAALNDSLDVVSFFAENGEPLGGRFGNMSMRFFRTWRIHFRSDAIPSRC